MTFFLRPLRLALTLLSTLTLLTHAQDSMNLDNLTTIPVSDPEVVKGLSPYNWVHTPDYLCATVCGASLKVSFSDTRKVILNVDTSNLQMPSPSRYPILAWSVNDGPVQSHQLVAGEKAITLASGAGDPVIDLYVKGMSPFENRYATDTPANAVKIIGFSVETGAKTVPTTFPSKIWLNIGDSIMSGDAAAYRSGQGRPPDDGWAASDEARASYGYLLAQHEGYRESRLAYGGYAWGGGAGGTPGLSQLIDQITSSFSRLNSAVLDPAPDVILINLGENGTPPATQVTEALTKIRSRAGKTAKMIMMIPISGKGRAELTAAFQTYKSTGDDQAYLLDLGELKFDTADGQHPTASGHQSVYSAALPKIEDILQGSS